MMLVYCVRCPVLAREGADLKIGNGAAIHAPIERVVEGPHIEGYLRPAC